MKPSDFLAWFRTEKLRTWLLVVTIFAGGATLYKIYLPNAASYMLDAASERIELTIYGGGPKFSWSDLMLRRVDGVSVDCKIDSLEFGNHEVLVVLTHAVHRYSQPDQMERNASVSIALHPRGKADSEPLILECSDGRRWPIRNVAELQPLDTANPTWTFFANVEAGGLPDTQGSHSLLLLSGTLRAAAKLDGIAQPDASNQYDLRPGDAVTIAPPNLRSGIAASGVLWPSETGFRIIAYAGDAAVTLSRMGLGTRRALDIAPSTVDVLKANPLWGLLTLVCAALSGIATIASAIRKPEA